MKLRMPSRAAWTLTAGMFLLVATTFSAQRLATASSDDEATAKLVCNYVERYHISRHAIDDGVSTRFLNRFLKALDPQKLYFTKEDIDSFQRYKTELDDLIKAGDVTFGYNTFDIYTQRVADRTQYAYKLIEQDFDYTIDESVVVDGDDLDWASAGAEMNERWRKRIKLEKLGLRLSKALKEYIAKEEPDAASDASDKADKKEDEDPNERLHKRYERMLKSVQELEKREQLELYLTALTHCFDPHSNYMAPETVDEFRIEMELSLDGIGAALRSDDGYTVVAQIVSGGAADQDGRLQVKDKIIGVGQGEDGELVDIVEMSLNKVVRLIRGKRGTVVHLRVVKDTSGETVDYFLTRQKIELTSREVHGEIIDTSEWLPSRPKHRIGVISIPSFYRNFRGASRGDEDFRSTVRDLERELAKFRDEGGVDGVIVDLRYNGGGALTEAIEVSGQFIKDGPVVQVKEHNDEIKLHEDPNPSISYAGPLVVICNRLSASASEIFAGAIKDYQRGLIVGDISTHGKGTVQNVIPVSKRSFQWFAQQDLGALKLTINQFYRVNGDSTQNKGVPSDIVLPSRLDHMELGESHMDNALPFDHIDPAPYEPLGFINDQMIAHLRAASMKRVAENPEFQETVREINRYEERMKRKEISLNESVRLKELIADRKDDEKKKADAEKTAAKLNGEGPLFEKDYYNREVLQITLDYVALFEQAMTAKR